MNLSRAGYTLTVGNHLSVRCRVIGSLSCELSKLPRGKSVLTVEDMMTGGKLTISFPTQKAVQTTCPTCDGSVVDVILSSLLPKPSGESNGSGV